MFLQDVLTKYDYDADATPFVRGSALLALEGKKDDPLGVQSIFNLMDAIDSHIPTPVRPLDKPFLMAIEDIFTISGRGTVVTGAVEQGVIKTGDNVEIVGWKEPLKAVVTGTFHMHSFFLLGSILTYSCKVWKCFARSSAAVRLATTSALFFVA